MSPEEDARPPLSEIISDLPLEQVIPWQVMLHGKEFPGEILALEHWEEKSYSAIDSGIFFRIVVFTRPQDVLPQSLPDPRLVFCLPGKLTYSLEENTRQYRAIRDRREGYLDQKEAPAPAANELQLVQKVVKEEAELYGSGRILTCPPLTLNPTQVFSLANNKERFDFMARSVCQYWDKLFPVLPQILAMKAYLDGVKLRDNDSELAIDRISIVEQLAYDNILSHPHLWPSLKALFDWFQSRYFSLYQVYHSQFQKELSVLHSRLKKVEPRLKALQQLNSIAELGEPLGAELFPQWQRLLALTNPCPLGEKPSIDSEPVCSGCGLSLTAQPPLNEAENFLEQLEQALGKQQHRLSSEAIRQILLQSQEERIDRFIKVVQASDLSALVTMLDDELVKFIRLLLAEGQYAR